MELLNQLPGSHPLTAPVHPPERVTGPPELHHSKGRYPALGLEPGRDRSREHQPKLPLPQTVACHPLAHGTGHLPGLALGDPSRNFARAGEVRSQPEQASRTSSRETSHGQMPGKADPGAAEAPVLGAEVGSLPYGSLRLVGLCDLPAADGGGHVAMRVRVLGAVDGHTNASP